MNCFENSIFAFFSPEFVQNASEKVNHNFAVQYDIALFLVLLDSLLLFQSTEQVREIRDQNVEQDDRHDDGSEHNGDGRQTVGLEVIGRNASKKHPNIQLEEVFERRKRPVELSIEQAGAGIKLKEDDQKNHHFFDHCVDNPNHRSERLYHFQIRKAAVKNDDQNQGADDSMRLLGHRQLIVIEEDQRRVQYHVDPVPNAEEVQRNFEGRERKELEKFDYKKDKNKDNRNVH